MKSTGEKRGGKVRVQLWVMGQVLIQAVRERGAGVSDVLNVYWYREVA
jgi:hypothetical protein